MKRSRWIREDHAMTVHIYRNRYGEPGLEVYTHVNPNENEIRTRLGVWQRLML